jgi:hypothetical protein
MASRIVSFVSCTLYFILLVNLTIIGFASLLVGCIGAGLFKSTSITYDHYKNTTCFIVDMEYDTCENSCYYVMWSVEYYISNSTSSQYTFSAITQIHDTSKKILEKVAIYKDLTNHTCYYDKRHLVHVQWDKPSSPTPYLIMMIVGFICTGIYLIFIGIFYYCRFHEINNIVFSK